MIENTLGSLVTVMGFTWIATEMFKNMLPRFPQKLLALIIGELFIIALWQTDQIVLDGVTADNPWSWLLVLIYGLVAVAMAAKAHDSGSNPKTLIKRVKGGKPIKD